MWNEHNSIITIHYLLFFKGAAGITHSIWPSVRRSIFLYNLHLSSICFSGSSGSQQLLHASVGFLQAHLTVCCCGAQDAILLWDIGNNWKTWAQVGQISVNCDTQQSTTFLQILVRTVVAWNMMIVDFSLTQDMSTKRFFLYLLVVWHWFSVWLNYKIFFWFSQYAIFKFPCLLPLVDATAAVASVVGSGRSLWRSINRWY